MKNVNLFLIGLILLTSSCKRHMDTDKVVMQEMDMERVDYKADAVHNNMMPPPPPPSSELELYNTKLIKKGSLTISSTNIETTKSTLYDFVKKCNGQIINENLVSNDPYSYYQISLNVQASLFDKFFKLIDSAKLNIISKSFSTEDVTMQFIDNTTRLDNKKKLEKRYLELLTKTKDIKDMLDIEEKLENIRSDIESRESQMKVMEKQIAYSEIHLRLEKHAISVTYEDKNKYTFRLIQGLEKGWQGIKSTIIFLISIWPIYLIVILIYYLVRYYRNKNNK